MYYSTLFHHSRVAMITRKNIFLRIQGQHVLYFYCEVDKQDGQLPPALISPHQFCLGCRLEG